MKKTIDFYNFDRAFHEMGRVENFTYEGRRALFDYLEDLEEELEQEFELDVIAFCCDYAEYENLDAFWQDYSKEEYPSIEAIRGETTVIEIEGTESFIILQF